MSLDKAQRPITALEKADIPESRIMGVGPKILENTMKRIQKLRLEEADKITKDTGMPIEFALKILDDKWTMNRALREMKKLERKKKHE